MQEFDFIDWVSSQAGGAGEGVLLGIGDDAAVLEPAPGERLVATTDTLNVGVHFREDDPPATVGHKALAVNLSDLAAMGALPRWALLSLSLPEAKEDWAHSFIEGFLQLARNFGVQLVGGDTTAGPLSIAVTALGQTRQGRYLARSGARPGDLVVVSGTVGDAAHALHVLAQGEQADPSVLERLRRPLPRVELGATLVGKATACIDISDGLWADLGHIVRASACGAVLEAQRLPASESLARFPGEQRLAWQLTGGDDYELCFTWPSGEEAALEVIASTLDLPLSVVGRIEDGRKVRCIGPDGEELAFASQGYSHKL